MEAGEILKEDVDKNMFNKVSGILWKLEQRLILNIYVISRATVSALFRRCERCAERRNVFLIPNATPPGRATSTRHNVQKRNGTPGKL